jgi:UDP-galactose transporter B1
MSLWLIASAILCFNLAWGLLQERVGGVAYGACSGAAPEAAGPSGCRAGWAARAADGLCSDCERFSAIPIMQVVQAAAAAALAGLTLWWRGRARPAGSSLADVLAPAVTHTIASPVGYLAMRFLPYPLYILVSSCKLVPVLLVGTWLNGVRRPLQDLISAAVMSQGVILYASQAGGRAAAAAAPHAMASDSSVLGVPLGAGAKIAFGIACVLTNLFLEGYTNAAQDGLFARARRAGRPLEALWMMADMNVWSCVFLALALGGEAALSGAAATVPYFFSFVARHPEVLVHIASFSVVGAVAQLFIFACLEGYGGFVTTSITVTRKIVSVLFSVVVFGHSLDAVQVRVAAACARASARIWTRSYSRRPAAPDPSTPPAPPARPPAPHRPLTPVDRHMQRFFRARHSNLGVSGLRPRRRRPCEGRGRGRGRARRARQEAGVVFCGFNLIDFFIA